MSDLQDGWTAHLDQASGKTFYHNASTGQTSWEKPVKQAAAAAAPAVLPAGWTEHVDPNSGKTFYYQASTSTTSWERPAAAPAAQALPADWSEHKDSASGRTFYHNAKTGETAWERPQAPQQAAAAQPAAAQPAGVAGAGLDEPLRSISCFLDEAKVVQDQVKAYEEQLVGSVLTEQAETLKQHAAAMFTAISGAAAELLPKAKEQAPLSGIALDALNTAVQSHELRYGCTKSEVIPVTLLMAKDKPGGRNYPTLVSQVETLCARTLPELEEREVAAYKAQLLRGGAHPTLDAHLTDLKEKTKASWQTLYQKYGRVLDQSDHTPVYKKIGSAEEMSFMSWNVMEFPGPSAKEPILEGLHTYCDAVLKELKREDDRQLLLDHLGSDDIIAMHNQTVVTTVIDAFEARGVDVVMLQEVNNSMKHQLEDLCRGKSWFTCFSNANCEATKCDAMTAIISNKDFQEEEAGGVEFQDGKLTRYFAAARRVNTWLVSCHVPLSNLDARDSVKMEAGVKAVQKAVQELHGKGKTLVIGGDWSTDVRGIQNRLTVQMPYGVSSCIAHTDAKTCFGFPLPVDGFLEIA